MGTNCYIGIKDNNSVKYIYCHWDGYPDFILPILITHYNSKDKAEELIGMGNISCLGSKLNPETKEHSFMNREPDTVVAYHRDRGDEWEECKPAISSFVEFNEIGFFYKYLFDPDKNCWLVYYEGRFVKPVLIP